MPASHQRDLPLELKHPRLWIDLEYDQVNIKYLQVIVPLLCTLVSGVDYRVVTMPSFGDKICPCYIYNPNNYEASPLYIFSFLANKMQENLLGLKSQ